MKRSAEASPRGKSGPLRSAMSILAFFINRAGRSLQESRKKSFERAIAKLREKFGSPAK